MIDVKRFTQPEISPFRERQITVRRWSDERVAARKKYIAKLLHMVNSNDQDPIQTLCEYRELDLDVARKFIDLYRDQITTLPLLGQWTGIPKW